MLITFKSKAAADVIMMEAHAKRILDLLRKDVHRGVITAAESDSALQMLESEIARSQTHAKAEAVQQDIDAHHNAQGDDNQHEHSQPISFAARAYPLLDMLREARKGQHDILWGV